MATKRFKYSTVDISPSGVMTVQIQCRTWYGGWMELKTIEGDDREAIERYCENLISELNRNTVFMKR